MRKADAFFFAQTVEFRPFRIDAGISFFVAFRFEHRFQILGSRPHIESRIDAEKQVFDEAGLDCQLADLRVVRAHSDMTDDALFAHLQDMTDEDWKTTMGINLDSVFFCCREAIPLFLKNSCGRIINISSVWGNVGASTEVAYSASKGGMNSLTKALAKELAPSGIAVNALACGFIDTKMNSHLSDEEKQAVIDEIPACRMCTVSEVADAVCLLAKMPVYMTGQIITIDGGWT